MGENIAGGNIKPPFKVEHSFEKRRAESQRIRSKYPDRIPVIVERSTTCNNLPEIDTRKYLLPESDFTIGHLVALLRKRIQLKSSEAMFIFVDNKLMMPNALLSHVYRELQDEDGFLYVVYSAENAFGSNL